MTAHKVIADALDDLAERLSQAADALRDLEVEPDEPDDERRRALARERTRRYRARRAADADVRYPRPRHSDAARDVTVTRAEPTNFDLEGAPSLGTDPREVGPSDDGEPVRNVTERDAVTRRDRDDDAQPGSPWRLPEVDDDEKARAQARIRELRDSLHEARGER